MESIEQEFAAVEEAAAAAAKSASDLLRRARTLEKAAKEGSIAAIRREKGRLTEAMEAAREAAGAVESSWSVEESEEEAYLRDQYAGELIREAAAQGLTIIPGSGGLMASPSIASVASGQRVLILDNKQTSNIRPSAVAKRLLPTQRKFLDQRTRASTRSKALLETLYAVYKELTRGDAVGRLGGTQGPLVALDRIYAVVTALPGGTSQYTRQDFARDIYILAAAGVTTTADGAAASFSAGSTGARQPGRTFRFADENGNPVSYYGVQFTTESGDAG